MTFDNTNLVNSCNTCDCTGFVASASFVYDPTGKTMTVTNHSSFGAGDGLKIMNIRVSDRKGNKASGHTSGASIDLSALDLSEGYQLFVTVLSNLGCISDGHVGSQLGTSQTSGNVGSWDKDSETIVLSQVVGPDDLES